MANGRECAQNARMRRQGTTTLVLFERATGRESITLDSC